MGVDRAGGVVGVLRNEAAFDELVQGEAADGLPLVGRGFDAVLRMDLIHDGPSPESRASGSPWWPMAALVLLLHHCALRI